MSAPTWEQRWSLADGENNFDPGDALERLHAEIRDLEAITCAAGEAIVKFPYPPPGETRRAFARIYALVTKAADEASAVVILGEQLVRLSATIGSATEPETLF